MSALKRFREFLGVENEAVVGDELSGKFIDWLVDRKKITRKSATHYKTRVERLVKWTCVDAGLPTWTAVHTIHDAEYFFYETRAAAEQIAKAKGGKFHTAYKNFRLFLNVAY